VINVLENFIDDELVVVLPSMIAISKSKIPSDPLV